jgi:WGR domain
MCVHLTIQRRDPSQNMARFYAVSLQADLLDGWSVVREWGRIGRPGRVRRICMTPWRRRKRLRRGWQPRSGARGIGEFETW